MMNQQSTNLSYVLPISSRPSAEKEQPSVDAPHPEPSPG